jgi:allantoinase
MIEPADALPDVVIRGSRVVTPSGIQPAAVFVRGGRIEAVTSPKAVPEGAPVVDADPAVVLPGLVDSHVHVNEPGRTDWEGFETATRAAALGGVTAFVDMPLNCVPPTTTLAALDEKRRAAQDQLTVDVATWGGVVPGNTGELPAMRRAGIRGFKCFLVPSGVEEFPHVGERELREALPVLRDLDATLLVHAELQGPIEAAERALDCEPRRYGCYLSSRPAEAEARAVDLLIELAREHDAAIHIVHLACADALPALRRARDEGLRVTAETCPHYLTFDAAEVPDGATPFKCAPPIRERHHADALWGALEEGLLEMVVTDHSPCPPDLKDAATGDFLTAWGGISSLQLGLAATWTEANARGVRLERVIPWLTRGPAELAGLGGRKGAIAPGYDADFAFFDPDRTFRVTGTELAHRHPLTPYHGRELSGVVEQTWLRGERVASSGETRLRGRWLEQSA